MQFRHQLDGFRRDVRQLIVQLLQEPLALGEVRLAGEITFKLVEMIRSPDR